MDEMNGTDDLTAGKYARFRGGIYLIVGFVNDLVELRDVETDEYTLADPRLVTLY